MNETLTPMSFVDLLLTIALATTPQTFQYCRFEGNADLADERFQSILAYYNECFPFSEETSQWSIKPSQGFVFSHCDFSGTQFSGWDLAHAEFHDCRFHETSFEACTLRNCKFYDCFYYNAQFTATVEVTKTRFRNSVLANTELFARWEQCRFTNCSLVGIKAFQAAFRAGEFSGGCLAGDLSWCDFAETTFSGVDMRSADLSQADFTRANFDDERFLIGHVLAEHASLDSVSEQEIILRQMAARYVQHCYASCWNGFVEAFTPYPGLLAWAYRVLKMYPCLRGKLRYHKARAPREEVALIEQSENLSQGEPSPEVASLENSVS